LNIAKIEANYAPTFHAAHAMNGGVEHGVLGTLQIGANPDAHHKVSMLPAININDIIAGNVWLRIHSSNDRLSTRRQRPSRTTGMSLRRINRLVVLSDLLK
jgi:hypothetical protein